MFKASGHRAGHARKPVNLYMKQIYKTLEQFDASLKGEHVFEVIPNPQIDLL